MKGLLKRASGYIAPDRIELQQYLLTRANTYRSLTLLFLVKLSLLLLFDLCSAAAAALIARHAVVAYGRGRVLLRSVGVCVCCCLRSIFCPGNN